LFVTLSSRTRSGTLSTSPSADASSNTSLNAATPAGSSTSLVDDEASSALGTIATTTAHSAAPSLAVAQAISQPALSRSAIAGVAVGGILALSLIGGGVFFLMRRHGRYPPPPFYEPDKGKFARERAGLDEPYSSVGVGGAVEFAELDGSAPVSPVMEPPVHLSASQRQARVAQNF
jgi:hypothetical protein